MKVVLFFIACVLVLPQSSIASPIINELEKNFELGSYFQGDIELTPEQEAAAFDSTDGGRNGRTGLLSSSSRWPKNSAGKVIVPYIISSVYSKLNYFKP